MTKFSNEDFKDFDKFRECRYLGIFDSGVGGLSILKYLNEYFDDKQNSLSLSKNNKEIIYVADSGRFPYGTKSTDEIITYTKQIIYWLEQQNVDSIIFGCNTASAVSSKYLTDMTSLPVLDLVEPVARYLSHLGLRVGILATEATVKSRAFSNAIKKYAPNLQVKEIASAKLVKIVERADIMSQETQELLSSYVEQFSESGTEIIVLSCTHFSFLKDSLSRMIGKNVQILDPAELIAKMLIPASINVTEQSNKPLPSTNYIKTTFFVTGNIESFVATATPCLGYPIKNVKHLPLTILESLPCPGNSLLQDRT